MILRNKRGNRVSALMLPLRRAIGRSSFVFRSNDEEASGTGHGTKREEEASGVGHGSEGGCHQS